jgi:hypothetical protein
MKLWRLPKIECSILKHRVPPLWPSYIGERRTTFAKAYGIKVRWYGEHVGEHLGDLMGTHWELKKEHIGNQGKLKKEILLPHTRHTHKHLKGKTTRHLE